jgi:hypothetical protein
MFSHKRTQRNGTEQILDSSWFLPLCSFVAKHFLFAAKLTSIASGYTPMRQFSKNRWKPLDGPFQSFDSY